MSQTILCCVYKTGGDYSHEYVKRLLDSWDEHADDQVGYLVLTDDPVTMDSEYPFAAPLEYNLPGWWSKLELFKYSAENKYIYFDLDTIIKGDISKFVHAEHKFTMLKDFSKKVSRPASGIMAWSGNYSHLLTRVLEDPSIMDKYDPKKGGKLGDQAYIVDHLGFEPDYVQNFMDVASYKWDSTEVKRDSQVICYHGKPRPHQTGWAW